MMELTNPPCCFCRRKGLSRDASIVARPLVKSHVCAVADVRNTQSPRPVRIERCTIGIKRKRLLVFYFVGFVKNWVQVVILVAIQYILASNKAS